MKDNSLSNHIEGKLMTDNYIYREREKERERGRGGREKKEKEIEFKKILIVPKYIKNVY